jgi:hypothetical protein
MPAAPETDGVAGPPAAIVVQLSDCDRSWATGRLPRHRDRTAARHPNGSTLMAWPSIADGGRPRRDANVPTGATAAPFTPRNSCEVSTESDKR